MLKMKSLIAKIRSGVRVQQCAVFAVMLAVSVLPVMPINAVIDNNQIAQCVDMQHVFSDRRLTFGNSAVNGPATVLLNQCGRSVNALYCLGSTSCTPRFAHFLASGELEVLSRTLDAGSRAACYHPFRPVVVPGGFNCDDGRSASVNECSSNNGGCSSNATCRDTDTSRTGGVQCTCNSGYTGNGLSCSRVSTNTGPNSCTHANDNECDDRNYPIHDTTLCAAGTDENDCRAANSGSPVTPVTPPSGGGGGGGGDDGGSDNTWLYIGGGVVVVLLLVAISGGFDFAPDITPIAEYSPDGAIYGARIETAAPEQSGAMWWEYREFRGNHLYNHSVEFGGDWAESGLFANAEINEGDAGIDWRASGGKEWANGQWALRSGVNAAGLSQFGQGPEVDLKMAVEYAADSWLASSGLNVSADAPSDAEVEIQAEWAF